MDSVPTQRACKALRHLARAVLAPSPTTPSSRRLASGSTSLRGGDRCGISRASCCLVPMRYPISRWPWRRSRGPRGNPPWDWLRQTNGSAPGRHVVPSGRRSHHRTGGVMKTPEEFIRAVNDRKSDGDWKSERRKPPVVIVTVILAVLMLAAGGNGVLQLTLVLGRVLQGGGPILAWALAFARALTIAILAAATLYACFRRPRWGREKIHAL